MIPPGVNVRVPKASAKASQSGTSILEGPGHSTYTICRVVNRVQIELQCFET